MCKQLFLFSCLYDAILLVSAINFVVASLDKLLHDIHSCYVESDKQQIEGARSKAQSKKSKAKKSSNASLNFSYV